MLTPSASLAEIRAVHLAAFPTPEEADLVQQILEDGEASISLGWRIDEDLAGHILFSKLDFAERTGALLAPVAVKPKLQNQGIGSALIRTGLEECRRLDLPFAAVLGHNHFYPRFGFSPQLATGLQAPWSGPHWMAIEFTPGCLANQQAPIQPAKAFRVPP